MSAGTRQGRQEISLTAALCRSSKNETALQYQMQRHSIFRRSVPNTVVVDPAVNRAGEEVAARRAVAMQPGRELRDRRRPAGRRRLHGALRTTPMNMSISDLSTPGRRLLLLRLSVAHEPPVQPQPGGGTRASPSRYTRSEREPAAEYLDGIEIELAVEPMRDVAGLAEAMLNQARRPLAGMWQLQNRLRIGPSHSKWRLSVPGVQSPGQPHILAMPRPDRGQSCQVCAYSSRSSS